MASGGGSDNNRQSYSEPRNRRALYSRLLNNEEEITTTGVASNSSAIDRLNNWDFSNWQPSSTFDGTKQPKRANEEKETGMRKRNGKENITAVAGESSPQADKGKQHKTPSTFPRTKVTPVMPMSQRIALENLRQHMTFSDIDETSTDGFDRDRERNNERTLPKRERPIEMSLERNEMGLLSNKHTEPSRDNRNTNKNIDIEMDEPDSGQIVGRLMQIRDYIKQASSMMERLENTGDTGDQNRASQLEQVVSRLKEQEQKYLELLLTLSTTKEDGLLSTQNTLPLLEDNGMNSQLESESEAATELDVCTDTSENEEIEEPSTVRRPFIEDKLGQQTPDIEENLLSAQRTNSRFSDSRYSDPTTPELDNTLVSETVNAEAAAADLLAKRMLLESDLNSKNDELNALKEQHDLLRKMLDQQEQLRELQTRQAELVMLQQEAEEKLADEAVESGPDAGSSNVGQGSVSELEELQNENYDQTDNTAYDDEENLEIVPQELRDLRQRLSYLKNLYDIKEQGSKAERGMDVGESSSVLKDEKAQLQSKLTDLHQKKAQMDRLLNELQTIKGQAQMNNEMDRESNSSSTARINESIAATAAANEIPTDDSLPGFVDMIESKNKLKKLQEVKDRLSQLKGLVQYYQSGQEFVHGGPSQPNVPDHLSLRPERPPRPEQPPNLSRRNPTGINGNSAVTRKKKQPKQKREQLDGSDTSETASQLSSNLGAWGEDPEIQEKVRRLNDAKEKLRRLQELVAVVQSSPDDMNALPDDLADLAASIEGAESQSSLPKDSNVSLSSVPHDENLSLAGAIAGLGYNSTTTESELQYDQQEAYYQMRMLEQKDELESLMDERKKLLQLQQELQNLHDKLPQAAGTNSAPTTSLQPPTVEITSADILNNRVYMQPSPNNRELAGETSIGSTQTPAQEKSAEPFGVTFQEPLETVISNEELYGRMRQQRMLREELREKKKELEDMMRKDRPKKQYSRNQDNQSDNVSYSTRSEQLFGGSVSVDQTMATWGGSTVDNLESIEEDGGNSGDGQEAEECDDGYPSDGIVQVEEEEEQDAVDDNSDDRDTYTIEEEPYATKARQPRRPTCPPDIDGNIRPNKRGSSKGAPFQGQGAGEPYNYWAPDNNQVLNNVRNSKSRTAKKKKVPTATLR